MNVDEDEDEDNNNKQAKIRKQRNYGQRHLKELSHSILSYFGHTQNYL